MSRFSFDFLEPVEDTDKMSKIMCDTCPRKSCWGECSFDRVYKRVTEKAPESVKPTYFKICENLKKGRNIFLTAGAGAGKSYLLKAIQDEIPTLTVTASTGVAALNVGGATLHSTLCIGIAKNSPEKTLANLKAYQMSYLRDLVFLAIDEVSMISGELLDYCDRFLRLARNNNAPFGGIQVILIGDFCQLPPVTQKGYYDFCFYSKAWQELNLLTFQLTHNFRQEEDPAYAEILRNLRNGILTQEGHDLFLSRQVESIPEDVPILFPTNKEVAMINEVRLAELPSEKYTYKAKYKSLKFDRDSDMFRIIRENLIKSSIMEDTLTLCKGARIMLLKNLDISIGFVNGTLGYVKDLGSDSITMVSDDGIESKIPIHTIETFDKEGKVLMTMEQYPVKLAYAVTVHKAQGATLEKVYIDFKNFFEVNQAYVALSRVKKSKGLYLQNYSIPVLRFEDNVLRFYKNLDNQSLN